MVTFEDFKKLDIITARIEEVREHPDAAKLLILKINTGDAEKEIVAGIKNHYSPQELVGKDIVVVNNLEPAVIRGVSSNAMLLAAQDGQCINLITPDKPVRPGSKIK